ncbi:MAG: GGDEF domain-containing protein [Vogesella sp.]|uniref:GGDEF domain-containing protein n=1 Tax=Vogesella sp. TaxID=1904252 RepID=UPI00391CC098
MQYHAHWLLLVTQLYLYALAWLLSQTQFKGHGPLLLQNTLAAFCMATGLLLPAILPGQQMLDSLPYAAMSGLLLAGFIYGANANRVFFCLPRISHVRIWLLTFSAGSIIFVMGWLPLVAPYRISVLNSMLAVVILIGLRQMHGMAIREFPGWSTWILHLPLLLFAMYLLASSIARPILGDAVLPEVTVASDLNVQQTVFYMVMAAFFNMMSIVRLGTRITRQLHTMSHRDPLTGLHNRRSLNRSYVDHPKAYRQRLCVVFVDIDHFKAINDNFGHHIGDEVLQVVGRTMMVHTTDRIRAYRLGGEEFCMVLQESSLPEGLALAETLRDTLARQQLVFDDKPLRLTASFGVACATQDGMDMDALMSAADEALYKAKRNGRNRVEAAVLAVSLV